jgi:hypothetical protein
MQMAGYLQNRIVTTMWIRFQVRVQMYTPEIGYELKFKTLARKYVTV